MKRVTRATSLAAAKPECKKPKRTSSKAPKAKKKEKEQNKKDEETKALANAAGPLLSLGKLVQGTLVRRPSEHNKSPYVADVSLGGREVMAHAPMLDLGGILMPGAVVRMKESKPGGKTTHSIQLVAADASSGAATWIGANPNLGNAVAKALIQGEHLTKALLGTHLH